MQLVGTIWTIIKEGHIRIIPAKFGKKMKPVVYEMSFEAIELLTTDDVHSMITINSSP